MRFNRYRDMLCVTDDQFKKEVFLIYQPTTVGVQLEITKVRTDFGKNIGYVLNIAIWPLRLSVSWWYEGADIDRMIDEKYKSKADVLGYDPGF